MPYVGYSSVANQANTTTGNALDVNAQVTSSLYFGSGVGGEGTINQMLSPTLNLNFALFGQTTLSPLINFSRTSNATITNSAGLIAYAPHNTLIASEQFDNANWSKLRSTVTANAIAAPDGTTTADLLLNTAVSGTHTAIQVITKMSVSMSYVASCYIKLGTRSKGELRISDQSGNGARITINLANGTVGSVLTFGTGFTAGTSAISALNDGWYRVSLSTITNTSTTLGHEIYVSNDAENVSYTGDGTGFYIWGAQLEIGTTATTYNSTTVKNLLGYSELFDNAAWTKSNSFVQTNLLTYSEDFRNTADAGATRPWSYNAITLTPNSVNAPNGYQTADKIVETTANSEHFVYQLGTTTAIGDVFTHTAYVKAAERSWCFLRIVDNSVIYRAWFNLSTGVLGTVNAGVTATITSVGDGWYRITLTRTYASAVSAPVEVCTATADNTYLFVGDASSGIYIWGAQLVRGSVAGDYRRTDAAALPIYYANHNGVVCAEQIHASAGNGTILESYTATGGSSTFSLWIRRITGTGNVDLTMDSGTTYTTQTITSSWARYSITSVPTAGAKTAGIRLVTSGDVVQVFGAMVSDSASLDTYVLNAAAAPSASAYYGPRFDYDPVTLQPKGLLIEEQRANLCVYSGTTSDANWSVNSVAKTSTNNLAPDGSLTAMLATSGGASATHLIFASGSTAISYTSGATYTFSYFVKAGTTNLIQMTGGSAVFGTSQYANYSLIGAGSVTASTGGTATIQQLADGWYRITWAVAATATITGNAAVLAFITSGTDTRVPTNTVSASLYIWGAQVEAGSFATSYIPTGASQATRTADVATVNGSNFYSWYNQNEGSIFTNASASSTGFTFIARNSSGDSYVSTVNRASNNAFEVYNLNVAQASLVSAALVSKIAGAYKTNDFAASVNNSAVATDTSGSTPLVSFASLGSLASNSLAINGTIKSIAYYSTRLSDSVLKGLTA